MITKCCFAGTVSDLKSQTGELMPKSEMLSKDLTNDYRLKEFDESLIPGAIDYTNYWNSFID